MKAWRKIIKMTEDHFPGDVGLEVDVSLLVGRVAPRLRQVHHDEVPRLGGGEQDHELPHKVTLAAPGVVGEGEAAQVRQGAVEGGETDGRKFQGYPII